jgi:hypothetical protein
VVSDEQVGGAQSCPVPINGAARPDGGSPRVPQGHP